MMAAEVLNNCSFFVHCSTHAQRMVAGQNFPYGCVGIHNPSLKQGHFPQFVLCQVDEATLNSSTHMSPFSGNDEKTPEQNRKHTSSTVNRARVNQKSRIYL